MEEEKEAILGEQQQKLLHLTSEEIFDLPGSRGASRWMLAFGFMIGLFSLVICDTSIAYNIPAWPTGIYNYGWLLSVPNCLTWLLWIAVPIWRNIEVAQWAFGIVLLQCALNLIVFLLQLIGAISSLINLTTDSSILGLVFSLILLVLSIIVLGALLFLNMVIIQFHQRPSSLAATTTKQHSQRLRLSKKEIFELSGSRTNLKWALAFSILLGVFAVITIGIAIPYGIDAWPTGPYDYGWVLAIPNVPIAILYLPILSFKNIELTYATLALTIAAWIINLIEFLLQISGGLTHVIDLNTDTHLYASAVSAILLATSTLPLQMLSYVVMNIAKFYRPSSSSRHRHRRI